ncbi:MAG: transporter [Candidatus Babeliaceae bacterium]|nr:transporter [Candidatus Babeliaceae bacterium]
MSGKIVLLFFVALFFAYQPCPAEKCCFTPRDISTDSMLELSLINYHRYHSLDTHKLSFYAKPFFTETRYLERTQAGMIFTAYSFVTQSVWLGINSAAMGSKVDTNSAGGIDDIQFKLGYDLLKIQDSHATVYLVATAPTGKTICRCPLNYPSIGSKKGSLGFGINLDTVVGEIGDYEFSWEFDLKYRHTFNPYAFFSPRNTIDLWTALNFPIYNFNLELGYDFWWQQSCRHSISASQKLYGDLGYVLKKNSYSVLLGLGAAYEFATKNALEKWIVWFTCGLDF